MFYGIKLPAGFNANARTADSSPPVFTAQNLNQPNLSSICQASRIDFDLIQVILHSRDSVWLFHPPLFPLSRKGETWKGQTSQRRDGAHYLAKKVADRRGFCFTLVKQAECFLSERGQVSALAPVTLYDQFIHFTGFRCADSISLT
jgi:hypothetical protein